MFLLSKARICLLVELGPVIFQKVEKNIFFHYIRRRKILFVLLKKNNIFLRFCLCILESATVKSNYPMQENYERFNTDCWYTLLVLLFVVEILKKSSESDQLTGHFQSLFFVPDPKSEKKSRKSTNKKFWPNTIVNLKAYCALTLFKP